MVGKRNTGFLLFILVLLTITIFLWWNSDSSSTFRAGERDFAVAPGADIVRIELQRQGESSFIKLYPSDSGRWMLNEGFYANESAVDELLAVLSRLTVRQPVSMANSTMVDQSLAESGVNMRVFIRSHIIQVVGIRLLPRTLKHRSFVVGADTPDGLSTYMRLEGASQAFKVHRPGFETGVALVFDTRDRVWRDPVVFDLPPDQISSVTIVDFADRDQSFRLRYQGGTSFTFHHIDSDAPMGQFVSDTARVIRFLSSFRDIYFESLLDEEGERIREENMAENPSMMVNVETTEGQIISITVWPRRIPDQEGTLSGSDGNDPNRFYVSVNEGEFAIAQYFVFNRILRPLSFFKNNISGIPVD